MEKTKIKLIPELTQIKGYVDMFDNLYFTDSAVMLYVEDGKGSVENLIVGNKKGSVLEADKLREDFFLHRNIEVEANRVRLKDNCKIRNRIFGDTIKINGEIKVDSKPKYSFCSFEKQGGYFPGFRIARLEEIK
jgi:hypothetical protein